MYGQQRIIEPIYIQDQYGYACKAANNFLSIFLFLLSIGVFGFGIWLSLWTTGFNNIGVILNYDIFRGGYILFIICGVLLMIVSFIGLCGGMQENSCLLLVFIIVIIISDLVLIAVAAIGLVFNQNFSSGFGPTFTNSIQRLYGVNLHLSRNKDVTAAIDQMQSQFSCCGVSGSSNSSTSWELYKSSTWILVQNNSRGPPYVPVSCCQSNAGQLTNSLMYCQGGLSYGIPAAPPVLNSATQNPYLNTQGCITLMTSSVNYFSLAMFGLALGAAIYLFIILILSICLLRRIEVSKHQMELAKSNATVSVSTESVKKNNSKDLDHNPKPELAKLHKK